MSNYEPFPDPNRLYFDYDRMHVIRLVCLKRLEVELACYLRNQSIIDDMKRRFGVSNREGK